MKSPWPAVHVGDAFATQLEHLTTLRASGNFDMGLAFNSRHRDLAAECRNGKWNGYFAVQIVVFAMENVVLPDVHDDIKITRRTAANARLAISWRT